MCGVGSNPTAIVGHDDAGDIEGVSTEPIRRTQSCRSIPAPSAPPVMSARSRGTRRTHCCTRSASAPARPTWPSPPRTPRTPQQVVFPTFAGGRRLGHGVARQDAMSQIGTFNSALLVHGSQAITLAPADPGRGDGHHCRTRSSRCTTRARRPWWSPRTRCASTAGEPLYTTPVVGVHPRRGRLGRRPWAVGSAERAAADTDPDHEVTYADLARPGLRVPALRRPQPAPHRPVVRRDRRVRPADPPRPVHLRLHRSGTAATRCATATPTRFHHIEGRFSSPVLPGEALTVKAVAHRRRRGRVHHVGRRPRRDRPGPGAVQLNERSE